MAQWIQSTFGTQKPVIAMVHFPALPGTPLYDKSAGMSHVLDSVRRDLETLQESGVDAVMFCNENDRPYQFTADDSTIAAMATVIGRLQPEIAVPYGVDILWDPVAAVALAHAVGAQFVREVFTGLYESDMGVWNGRAAEALRLRTNLGETERIKLLFNVSAEFASPIGHRTIADIAQSVAFSSLPDALCVSGPMTGRPVDPEDLESVRQRVGGVPVFVNTGVRADNVNKYLSVADGVIVGTSLKFDGKTFNAVDLDRARMLMKTVQELRIQLTT
ncbi:photosystem I assembly BtpA [Sulfobacillus acidophilus TPY]|uniref:Photosystem I assembly BtpA n=1 Tax=Sulfobacillus acidophilus (strain ATCC 700253 / DSM 10332 / NAL) TaxID=679936 RepID=G8TV11_SULAD|nr:photosystem I assembly BtpA [Sulfobacillus acidophilus TPY]AEW03592.1 photosystem I assembly BtpA [Sulfobacillus acidophilus DSM 10332]